MRALGAGPVAIPMPEVYTAMERGVVDGTFTTPETMDLFRLSHVCNEITKLESLTFAFCLVMNKAKWEQLPEPAKAVLEKNAEKYGLMAGMTHDKHDEIAINTHKPKIYKLTANELKTIKTLMAPSFKQYVDKYESAGYKAKDAAKTFYKCLESKFGVEPYIMPD
jgi:TRAP-type C4-dicarboxylate transport system substrate-binding protein